MIFRLILSDDMDSPTNPSPLPCSMSSSQEIKEIKFPILQSSRQLQSGVDGEMVEMFRKMLTPSDFAGRLNRLVISKQDAMSHLPPLPSDHEEGLLLQFTDREDRRVWAFRYYFWKSCQIFVFTKGWKEFIREKRLKANDAVVFYYSVEEKSLGKNFFLVDVVRSTCNSVVAASDQEGIGGVKLSSREAEEEGEEEMRKKVKLFGVWIDEED